MFGYSLDEFTRRLERSTWFRPSSRGNCPRKLAAAPSAKPVSPTSLSVCARTAANSRRWCSGSRVFERTSASVGTVIDLSSQRRAEQALVDSTHRYSVLFEGALDAIVVADAESGRIIDANVAAEILLKRPHEEMIGMTRRSARNHAKSSRNTC